LLKRDPNTPITLYQFNKWHEQWVNNLSGMVKPATPLLRHRCDPGGMDAI
jgi:hypothetical protein